jgi:hypothetical protein
MGREALRPLATESPNGVSLRNFERWRIANWKLKATLPKRVPISRSEVLVRTTDVAGFNGKQRLGYSFGGGGRRPICGLT